MKVQILSDLHVDFKENYKYFSDRCIKRADTLIVAGDIHPHKRMDEHGAYVWSDKRETFINEELLPRWKNVIVIPGNHEFYGSTVDDEWFGKQLKVYENDKGNKVHYCNNHVLQIDGVYFVCSTLWSHIGHSNSYAVKQGLNDYRMISGLTIDRMNEIHQANKDFLVEALTEIPDGKRCVFITHHVPSFHLIHPRWRGNSLNEAFSADMDTFIMMNSSKISYWVHGHSHDYLNEYIDRTKFIRNPMGYPAERHGDMDMVIDI